MASGAIPPALFDPANEDWDSYIDRFQMFLETNNLKDATASKKRAVFLTHCGPAVFKMAKALAKPAEVKNMDWDVLAPILRNHYAPVVPTLIRRHEFYQRDQKDGESIGDFVADLRNLGGLCNFDNLEEAMRDRVVLGLKDATVQSKIMAKGDISLQDAITEATTAEATRKSAARMRRSTGANRQQSNDTSPRSEKRASATHHEDIESSSDSEEDDIHRLKAERESRDKRGNKPHFPCAGCGGNHPRSDCRFNDAICRYCDKRGHIARVCRNKRSANSSRGAMNVPTTNKEKQSNVWNRIRPTQNNYRREETHQTIHIGHASSLDSKKIRITVAIENQPCLMEVDSGSTLSMVSWKTLKKLIPRIQRTDLSNQRLILKDYQGNRIPIVGTRHFQVSFKDHQAILPLTIVDKDRPSLLGLQWFAPLGIEMAGINHTTDTDWEASLIQDFREVFSTDLGKYKGPPISFNLNPEIAPIRLKPRRVPFALKPKIDEQLDKLIAQGVLEPIDHARWETPIVTPIKPDGSLRICGDYKATLNHALQQSAYPVPVVQHLLHSLGGGKIFAKLDLAQAYQQLPVDPKTAEAQTIVTHRGAFKCNRLQFGVSVAPGIFQSLMERLLQNIKGVVPYFDDVLIAAPNRATLEKRLRNVLQKFKEVGLRVKRDKCQLCTERVEFLGYLLDKQGIHPTEKKVAAINNAPRPRNKTDLQAFLGLINFYNIFLPHKATVAEPLHRLLDKKAAWVWGRREEHAFRQIKTLLTSDAVLIQYNETLPLTVTCDASPFGVGAILSHVLPNGTEAPVAYFSRTLTKPERNYSQLDKEALAIVSAIKRFHEYIYGRPFTVVTDHKPLLGILQGNRPTPHILSPRMTRWSEFLAAYDYQLEYRPGKAIPHADALSRAPLPESQEDPAPTLPVLQIEAITAPPLTALDIALETKKDSCLAQVLRWVEKGWPDSQTAEMFKPFKNRQTELFSQKGCILWGDRVVIPPKLQKKVLHMLHEGHPGIVRMKALARSYAWWPGIDKQVETWVASCNMCQKDHPAPPKTTPTEWETPRGPWSRIHIDFAGPTKGQTFLITVDAYSNWLEVHKMKTTTTEAVIKKLNRLFATHGLPDVLVSDNGPQFTALAFEQYLAERGIRHALTAPGHPATNGRAEKMVHFTKTTLHKMGPGDIDDKISRMLLLQHITPNTTSNKSPAELLMARKLRSPLDRMHPTYTPEKPLGSSSKHRTFKVGDAVFAKNFVGDPLWLPAIITQVTGPRSYRLQTLDGRSWKRHIDQLRSRIALGDTVDPTRGGRNGREHDPDSVTAPDLVEYHDQRYPRTESELENADSSPGSHGGSRSAGPSTPGSGAGGCRGDLTSDNRSPGEVSQLRPESPARTSPAANLAGPDGGPEQQELRRSGRPVRKPAYLEDYITPPLRRNLGGRSVLD